MGDSDFFRRAGRNQAGEDANSTHHEPDEAFVEYSLEVDPAVILHEKSGAVFPCVLH